MENDYQRHRLVKNITKVSKKMIGKSIMPILCEWSHILMSPKFAQQGSDIMYNYSFDLTSPANMFLLDRLRYMGLVKSRHWAVKYVHRINALIRQHQAASQKKQAKVHMAIYVMSYKQFYKKFRFNQFPSWLHVGRNNILQMLLRYESVRWNEPILCIPTSVWDILIYDFRVWLEGFASPIDNQIMKYSGPSRYFCSMFPDTDAPFGSMGNFFTMRIRSGDIMVHPPACLVWDAVIYIIQCCIAAAKTSENIRFFFFAQCSEIPIFDTSEFLTYKHVLQPDTFYYESCGMSGQKYKTIGKGVLGFWVLENNQQAGLSNYEKIPLAMGVDKNHYKIENYVNKYNTPTKGAISH